jgi:hypothetical protein
MKDIHTDLLKHFVTCAYDKFFIAWKMIHDEKGEEFCAHKNYISKCKK